MLTVSKCTARGARDRKESRGGHTREDFPGTDAQLAKVNITHTNQSGDWRADITTTQVPLLEMPADLKALLEEGK
jgi:succinate dehydrogenase / fumarate reductase flavoprotein subunit